jgi:hypothetical protein
LSKSNIRSRRPQTTPNHKSFSPAQSFRANHSSTSICHEAVQ